MGAAGKGGEDGGSAALSPAGAQGRLVHPNSHCQHAEPTSQLVKSFEQQSVLRVAR